MRIWYGYHFVILKLPYDPTVFAGPGKGSVICGPIAEIIVIGGIVKMIIVEAHILISYYPKYSVSRCPMLAPVLVL